MGLITRSDDLALCGEGDGFSRRRGIRVSKFSFEIELLHRFAVFGSDVRPNAIWIVVIAARCLSHVSVESGFFVDV